MSSNGGVVRAYTEQGSDPRGSRPSFPRRSNKYAQVLCDFGSIGAPVHRVGTAAAEAPATGPGQTPPDPAGVQFFENKVRPVLVDNCYKCHSAKAQQAKKLKGELLLDTHDGLLKGGENGRPLVPGKPDESRLIMAVRYTDDDLKMPPKVKLSAEAIGDLEKWVAMGAPDPPSHRPRVRRRP